MELDELKQIWNKSKTSFTPKNEDQLAQMLKGNSRSIVDKLKRSVWFELIFTLVAGIVLLVYALTLPSGALKSTSVSVLILFVLYLFYYIKKLLLLKQFHGGDDNLKESLEKLVTNLTSYLKFYKRSYTILYPVYFSLGILYGAIETGSTKFIEIISNPKVIGYLTALALIFYIASTWFTKWYLKKLYGNHLEKLKAVLQELKSVELTDES